MSIPARPFGPVLTVETLLVVEALLCLGHLYTKNETRLPFNTLYRFMF